jgi:MFS transporter, FHS family, glucose/mannose:H+ symporter
MSSPTGSFPGRRSPGRTLAVLHPVFALTGILHSIGGPLLPSLAFTFHLSDSQAGFLFLAYYAGTSLGALFCGRNHARSLTIGFLGLTCVCVGVAVTNRTLVFPLFLLLGICVGMPMTAVSMLAGRRFGAQSAAPLTFLNFSWSAGALIAPLLAARLLTSHSYRAAYLILAGAAALAAIACWWQLEDSPEPAPSAAQPAGIVNLRFIALFALLTFLEVGIENTTGSWLATYVLRTSGVGAAVAAAASSVYWCGFLASRGLSSLLLLRIDPARLLRFAIVAALVAAVVLVSLPGTAGHVVAMIVLGAALAPIFPLLLARFFAHARRSSDSRWVLAVCGFGGSVLPWVTGWVSARSGSLRLGLITVPAALLLMISMMPMLAMSRGQPDTGLPPDE